MRLIGLHSAGRALVCTGTLCGILLGCASSGQSHRETTRRVGDGTDRPRPVTPSRPATMVRLENAQTTPDVHKGSVDLAKIAAGEAVTILVRDLQLHLAPNNQSTYTFSFNPFDPGDPCGTTLCYVTPTANVLEFYQIGNCWITTGPPVYVVTLTYAEPCFR